VSKIFHTFICFFLVISFFTPGFSHAASWQDDFERICGSVPIGESLSIESLDSLIEESEHLKGKIEKSGHPTKKVYLFRLKKCRSFFQYLMEQRNEK
jgi:hypothetical protein